LSRIIGELLGQRVTVHGLGVEPCVTADLRSAP
jgi:hypothetical protein